MVAFSPRKPRNPIRLTYLLLFAAFMAYSGFVYRAEVPQAPTSPAVAEGKMLWQKHNCSSCHQLYGLGGYLGPDLTNVVSEKGKGRLYAAAIMQKGTRVMPDFNLTPTEIEALLAFLEHTDKTGRTAVQDFITETDGSIRQKEKGEETL